MTGERYLLRKSGTDPGVGDSCPGSFDRIGQLYPRKQVLMASGKEGLTTRESKGSCPCFGAALRYPKIEGEPRFLDLQRGGQGGSGRFSFCQNPKTVSVRCEPYSQTPTNEVV